MVDLAFKDSEPSTCAPGFCRLDAADGFREAFADAAGEFEAPAPIVLADDCGVEDG